jgi:hypothetical protein
MNNAGNASETTCRKNVGDIWFPMTCQPKNDRTFVGRAHGRWHNMAAHECRGSAGSLSNA